MYDQSFCASTLQPHLQRHDFRKIPAAKLTAFREKHVLEAISSAENCFGTSNPIISFPLHGKIIYNLPALAHELVARKLSENLKRAIKKKPSSRSKIISCLELLLREGTPYRVYRLDISKFYESFTRTEIIRSVNELQDLSPQSKLLISSILNNHDSLGGTGIPRGLSLSATLSDFMMSKFDSSINSNTDVFYYSRYVDDIIIVTSAREDTEEFLREIKTLLPQGLELNKSKEKNRIVPIHERVKPIKQEAHEVQLGTFEYLGYAFSISEPTEIKKKLHGAHERKVAVEIADSKIRKIKTRIVRSLISFNHNKDYDLLLDRIKFLSQNFSVYNAKAGGKKLAGIFHSYPQISEDGESLRALDLFLRNALLSKTGRIFKKTCLTPNSKQKRELMAQSFARGHKNRSFIHFAPLRISEIQKCWIY